MRIAIGGFLHESHSFAPRPTGWRQFFEAGGFPNLQYAAAMIDTLRPLSVPAGGAIAVAEAAGAGIVPLVWCFAYPAGPAQNHDATGRHGHIPLTDSPAVSGNPNIKLRF
jgi:microcystin degradation protein MlrC